MEADKQQFLDDIRQKVNVNIVDFMKTWFKFDADRNGSLDKDEVKDFLSSVLEPGKVDHLDQEVERLMKFFDINSDGKIELNEFSLIVPVENNYLEYFRQDDLSENDFKKMFEHYDKDGNNYIEDDELSAFMVDLKRSQIEDEKELNILQLELEKYKQFIMDCCGNTDGRFSKKDLKLLMLG